ncbi:DUF6988 family protein [Methylotenera versatilis]|uniref:Uncharacterized protein n=1 Tax=Methylotenera versatilis (strain 301) TaxID=666681 RepID=D7DM08_METV0|nr:hypothetical protein [Methylotenera versatilis]ADI30702.1 conserved hypothetical protein [Methylotenera versatilis 301]
MDSADKLNQIVIRSKEFEAEMFHIFESISFPSDNKSDTVIAIFNIAQEHALALRELTQMQLLTSAMAMLRLQYEAVVREVWVLYIASDIEINKLSAPLTKENEQIASNGIPSFSEMMKAIEKKGPVGLHRHLSAFKDNSWRALNSFIHSGIHAVSRHKSGYPVDLLYANIQQSNNLSHMSAIGLAELSKNSSLTMSIATLYKKYGDCMLLE